MKKQTFFYSILEGGNILWSLVVTSTFFAIQKIRVKPEEKNWSSMNKTPFQAFKTQNFEKKL